MNEADSEFEREFLTLSSGRTILDEDLSEKMYQIKSYNPEKQDKSSSGFEWSEMGWANLFGELYREEALFCPEHRSWYTYHEGAWRKDVGALLVSGKIKEFVRLMILYCGEITDDDLRKSYTGFVNKMGDRRMRDRVMKDAEDELKFSATQFDTNPYLVNCKNGTYDLATFTFNKPRWNDYITMQTDFDHTVSRDVKCDRWELFIDEITQGDKDKANYIQKALGYSMLGKSNEACIFILHGMSTRNGKSTVVETIQTMLGDYACTSPVGLISRQKYANSPEAATPELAKLKGKRFVTMAEPEGDARLDEQKIKVFTGGEELTGRGLREPPISFYPQFTIWMTCNDLPEVRDRTLFASDRIRLIELNRHFTEAEQDKTLGEYFKTQEARKGIFMWLVRGYIRYKNQGLKLPQSMKHAIVKYEKDNDLVSQFLDARCKKMSGCSIKSKDFHTAHKLWAKSEGASSLSARKLNAEMERHSEWFEEKAILDGCTVYRGLGLKEIL